MKRPLKRNGSAATSHPGGTRFAAAWFCGLFVFVVGCTGTIGPMQSGAGGASNPSGSGGSGMGGGQTGGSAGPGTAGQGGAAPVSAAIPTRFPHRRRRPCWWRRPGWRGSAGSSGRTPSATCSS